MGTRTPDPMIKSHLLYQLSYVPKTEPENNAHDIISNVRAQFCHIKNQKSRKNTTKIVLVYKHPNQQIMIQVKNCTIGLGKGMFICQFVCM